MHIMILALYSVRDSLTIQDQSEGNGNYLIVISNVLLSQNWSLVVITRGWRHKQLL